MIIQTNIDKSDVIDALRGTRRGFAGSVAQLALCFVLLCVATVYGLAGLYEAFSAFGRNVNQRFGAPLAEQVFGFGVDMLPILLNLVGLGLAAVLWWFLYRSGRTLRNGGWADNVKHGLSIGKSVIDLSETHLVVKTALKVQKIAWAAFVSFEETKTSLIFHYADGDFEFIPKSAVATKGPMEKLCAELKRRVEGPLSRATDDGASALTLSYEFADADDDEFRRWSRRERDKTRPLIRRLAASPYVIAAVFCYLALLSAIKLFAAAARLDASLFGAALIYAATAGVLMLTQKQAFSGLTRHIRLRRPRRFAQTNPTTVTLSKTAVFYERRGVKNIYQWAAFDGLVQAGNAAYLVLSPASAVALPKRAFMDDAHYHRFIAFATARLAAAKRAQDATRMHRLQKSAATTGAAARPILQKSHRSDAEQSDDSPAAPADKHPHPTLAARSR